MHQRYIAALVLAACCIPASAADIVVSAASSLSNAFKEISQRYEAEHPGSKVLLNMGASGALLQQLSKGAPADVFASADEETMDAAVAQGLVAAAERHDFARNTLVLVVPADSKLTLAQPSDLARPEVKRVAVGQPASVPAGRYTRHALEGRKLWPAVEAKAIYTQNVRQALDYVARGEVDAGFVYATDAAIVPNKVKLVFALATDTPIAYPIATVRASANAAEARRFVAFVLSKPSQEILARLGFGKP